MRTQFLNRNYESKYNNEAYNFFKSLNPEGMFKETAEMMGVTYYSLYNSFKTNHISYRLKVRIENTFKLNDTQKEILNQLVLN